MSSTRVAFLFFSSSLLVLTHSILGATTTASVEQENVATFNIDRHVFQLLDNTNDQHQPTSDQKVQRRMKDDPTYRTASVEHSTNNDGDYYQIAESRLHLTSYDDNDEKSHDALKKNEDFEREIRDDRLKPDSKRNVNNDYQRDEYTEVQPERYTSHVEEKTSRYGGDDDADDTYSKSVIHPIRHKEADSDIIESRSPSSSNHQTDDKKTNSSIEPDTSSSRYRQRVSDEVPREYFADYDYEPPVNNRRRNPSSGRRNFAFDEDRPRQSSRDYGGGGFNRRPSQDFPDEPRDRYGGSGDRPSARDFADQSPGKSNVFIYMPPSSSQPQNQPPSPQAVRDAVSPSSTTTARPPSADKPANDFPSNQQMPKDQISRSSYDVGSNIFSPPAKVELVNSPVPNEIRRGFVELPTQFAPSVRQVSLLAPAPQPEPAQFVNFAPVSPKQYTLASPQPEPSFFIKSPPPVTQQQHYTVLSAPQPEPVVFQAPQVQRQQQYSVVAAAPQPTQFREQFIVSQAPQPQQVQEIRYAQAAPPPIQVVAAQQPQPIQFIQQQQAPQPINVVAAQPPPQTVNIVAAQAPQPQRINIVSAPAPPPPPINIVAQAPQPPTQTVFIQQQQQPQQIHTVIQQAPQPEPFFRAVIAQEQAPTLRFVESRQAQNPCPVALAPTFAEKSYAKQAAPVFNANQQKMATYFAQPMPQKTRSVVREIQFMPTTTHVTHTTSYSPATKTTVYETDHVGAYSNNKAVLIPAPISMPKTVAPVLYEEKRTKALAIPASSVMPRRVPLPMPRPFRMMMPSFNSYYDSAVALPMTKLAYMETYSFPKMNKLLKAPLMVASKFLDRKDARNTKSVSRKRVSSAARRGGAGRVASSNKRSYQPQSFQPLPPYQPSASSTSSSSSSVSQPSSSSTNAQKRENKQYSMGRPSRPIPKPVQPY